MSPPLHSAPLHDAFPAPNVRQLGVTVFSTA